MGKNGEEIKEEEQKQKSNKLQIKEIQRRRHIMMIKIQMIK